MFLFLFSIICNFCTFSKVVPGRYHLFGPFPRFCEPICAIAYSLILFIVLLCVIKIWIYFYIGFVGLENSQIKVFCRYVHQTRPCRSFFEPSDTIRNKFREAGISRFIGRFNDTSRSKYIFMFKLFFFYICMISI